MSAEDLRKKVLAIPSPKKVALESPFDGCYLQVMSGKARDQFEDWVSSRGKTVEGCMSALVVRTLVDSEGKRLFKDAEWELLNTSLDSKHLGVLFKQASSLNGLTQDEVESIAKN